MTVLSLWCSTLGLVSIIHNSNVLGHQVKCWIPSSGGESDVLSSSWGSEFIQFQCLWCILSVFLCATFFSFHFQWENEQYTMYSFFQRCVCVCVCACVCVCLQKHRTHTFSTKDASLLLNYKPNWNPFLFNGRRGMYYLESFWVSDKFPLPMSMMYCLCVPSFTGNGEKYYLQRWGKGRGVA